jgi:hypothetical protein
MADLTISNDLADQLKALAESEQRSVEATIRSMLDHYVSETQPQADQADPLLKAIPPDVENKATYLEALREMRPKLYRKARDYWQRVGDHERLALTDRELDEQFWLIDPDGVPRLKSDQAFVILPHDPLADFLDLFEDSDLTDMSTTVRETMADYYRKKHEHPD